MRPGVRSFVSSNSNEVMSSVEIGQSMTAHERRSCTESSCMDAR